MAEAKPDIKPDLSVRVGDLTLQNPVMPASGCFAIEYQEALDLIQKCASKVKNKDGRQYSAFLDNRLRATVVYLKAYLKGTEIQKFDASKRPTDADRKAIAEICNRSILQFEQYLQIHSEMMPDRGCEGTLISAYYTPGAVLKRIRKEYGDVPYETQTAPDKTLDAPPAPIKFSP